MADEDQLHLVRQGFWLRMARERAGKSQKGAAEYLGLSGNSKSSVSDYENAITQAPQTTLRKLARWYGVPYKAFNEPLPTAFEALDDLARAAIGLAREDLAAEEEADPGDEAPPGEQPRRRSA